MKHFAPTSALALLGLVAGAGCSASTADVGSAGAGGYQGAGGAGGLGAASGGTGGGATTLLRATGIAVGAAHSCALLEDGTVACWGDGSLGQLGDGSSGDGYLRAVPAVVPGLTGVTAISAGGDVTCAITGGGAAVCWGDGAFGQLGDGMSGDGHLSATPVAVVQLDGVTDLSVSGTNACAVGPYGTVFCWGRNAPEEWLGFDSADCGPYTMQMGTDPPTLVSVPCAPTPTKVPGAIGAVAVASGGEHNCARESVGGASCWGADEFGQLGYGASGLGAHQGTPTAVLGIVKVQRLALGASHSCAIVGAARDVLCWGDNSAGQLGIGIEAIDSYKITPTAVTSLTAVVDLDAAAQTTCAAKQDGTVACWGDTSTVLPVSPSKGGAVAPTLVPGVAGAIEVRTSGAHACARLADLGVVCWGTDDHGQLGNGNTDIADFSLTPVAAPSSQGGPG